uniref:Uncharacterized protein n=1 Tax=Heterorhabditis bacteriophora TaxID=37862 RepID=A0A1I7WP32_HETBA
MEYRTKRSLSSWSVVRISSFVIGQYWDVCPEFSTPFGTSYIFIYVYISNFFQVFEHQRELALSLIERLPISTDGAHVAVGINSFTSVPTLRLTLGLGRDKKVY